MNDESEILLTTKKVDLAIKESPLAEYLLHPNVVAFIDFKGLIQLNLISKTCRTSLEQRPEESDFWRSLCCSFCFYAGVYSHIGLSDSAHPIFGVDCKKYFFTQLWKNRSKWETVADAEVEALATAAAPHSYRVKVACRFRPGELRDDKVVLPLHQFIKVKRHQKKQQLQQQTQSQLQDNEQPVLLVGEQEPEEFLDPFLGHLMRDPVLLTTSNRVVDRAVAVQCVIRGGRDPFNNRKLTSDMLLPQPELSQRIEEWRRKKLNWDHVGVEVKDLKPLMDEQQVNAEFLSALPEVERINNEAMRAEQEANLQQQQLQQDGEEIQQAAVQQEDAQETDNAVGAVDEDHLEMADVIHPAVAEEAMMNPLEQLQQLMQQQQLLREEDDDNLPSRKKNETARVVSVDKSAASVAMHVPGSGVRPFHYAQVHDAASSQRDVYANSAQEATEAALNGFNACVMCYGQTGSGKTFTFFGPEGCLEEATTSTPATTTAATTSTTTTTAAVLPQHTGIVLRTCLELLEARDRLLKNGVQVSYTAQFVELYEEQAIDLLTGRSVQIRRDNGEVRGALEAPLDSLEQVQDALRAGHERKRFAATAMNERSSRSHTAFIVRVRQRLSAMHLRGAHWITAVDVASNSQQQQSGSSLDLKATPSTDELTLAASAESDPASNDLRLNQKQQQEQHKKIGVCASLISAQNADKLMISQLHLVDLAGSERVKRSQVEGQRMREAVGINTSLLVLGRVISALVSGQSHVPYLESKLTTLLKSAFGGNSQTTVMINCRADGDHGDETLQSMRFGERCGMVSNSMRKTAASFAETLRTVQAAVQSVRQQLASLELRGKQQLPSYKSLAHSYSDLRRKRDELLHMNGLTVADITAETAVAVPLSQSHSPLKSVVAPAAGSAINSVIYCSS